MLITSKHNPTLKRLLELRQSKGRRQQGRFLLDGQREIQRALSTGHKIISIYYCKDFKVDPELIQQLKAAQIEFVEVAAPAFALLAYRENPYGILAELETWDNSLENLKLSKAPTLVLVAEFLEKPGNLGTFLRTADGVGADAVISCEAIGDLFNPNALRASQGAAFSVPYAVGTRQEVIQYLRDHHLQIIATSAQAPQSAWQIDYRVPTAFVMGSESQGLTEPFMQAADHCVHLPMKGIGDSLNVAVSCGIIAYEALRQRQAQ